MYIGSAILKRFEDDGRQVADLPYVHYAMQLQLHLIGQAFRGFFKNFPKRWMGRVLSFLVFPWGNRYDRPADDYAQQIAESMMEPGVLRERHTFLSYWQDDENDVTGHMELAFLHMHENEAVFKKFYKAQKQGVLGQQFEWRCTG